MRLHNLFTKLISPIITLTFLFAFMPISPVKAAGTVSLTTFTAYQQDFDTLANTSTSSTVPNGWDFIESGTNANTLYSAGTGSGTGGDTYSFGAVSATDRAFGGLQSGNLNPTIGASFTNNTGGTISELQISYTGEQWRLGATARVDRTDFQYSTDATSLTTGTWINADALDFTAPVTTGTTGALDGNAAANRTAISGNITGLTIANGSTFWIRWQDLNASGADDGLAIDDFLLTPVGTGITLSINNAIVLEGDSGITTATFTVTLSSPAILGGVTFDIATADGSATTADSDYAAQLETTATIAEGASIYTFTVSINGDTTPELDENFIVNITNITGATATDGQGLGIIQNDDAVIPVLTINDVTQAEGNTGTSTFIFTATLSAPAPAGGVTFDIATIDGTATTANNDYTANSVSGATIITGTNTYTFTVGVNGDTVFESNETFSVTITNLTAGIVLADGEGIGTITNDDILITPIYTIQGSGAATTIPGIHTTEGIVIGDFEGGSSPQIRGFYIQDGTGDSNPATSDGIFIYNGSNNNVALGDLVRVTGTVSEYNGQTQISSITNITVLSSGHTLTPTVVTLPFASIAEQEQYEDMLVVVTQTLYVTEHYLLGRFGQVTLSGSDRLYQPTNIVLPGAPAAALQAANDLNRIILDDASQSQNPDPILFGRGGNPLSASNTLRGGDTLTGVVGVFDYTWGGNSSSPNAYRIRPINALGGGIPNFVAANTRPTTPEYIPGSTFLVSMNLLNYFNTFDGLPDTVDNCTNGVDGAATDCRGADDATEFVRQADKIVNAIVAMDAHVYGIVEIENDGYGSESAIQDLVDRLNAATSPNTYAFIDVDAQTGITNALGTDAIKVGLLYRPEFIMPVGQTAVLDTVEFVNGGDSEPRNRVSLLQGFEVVATGEHFVVNVNHLKSKGSVCDDPDTGDGQGNCSIVRTNAVNELTAWLATDPTGLNDPDVIVLGDLNSYSKEDPIAAFENAGYLNLMYYFSGADAYSYVFDGQWGYLDYAIGSPSMTTQVASVTEWHVNADEPIVLDYNTNFKTPGQIISLYSSDPFRTGDHDPVRIGLNLDQNTPSPLQIHKSVETAEHVAPGDTVTYTVQFTNTIDYPAQNILVSDILPAAVTFGQWLDSHNAIESNNVITWTGNLNYYEVVTFSFTAIVSPDADHNDIVTNVAQYTYATSSGHASASFVVYLPPALSIEKSVTPSTLVTPGSTVTYTIEVANATPTLASDVMLTDTLPAAITFGEWVANPGAIITDGEITWSGSIASQTALTLVFTGIVSDDVIHEQVVNNTAIYAHPYGSGQDDVTFDVYAPPALTIEKTITPDSEVAPGSTVTYTIQLHNTTPSTASGILLTDTLPAEVTFGEWVTNDGASITNGQITWSGGLQGNASLTLIFTAIVSAETNHNQVVPNTVSFTHAYGSGLDTASFTVYLPPALTIEKSVTPTADVAPGSTVTYTIQLHNTTPTLAAGVTLTDALPAGVTFGNWLNNTGATIADGVITWTGSLGENASLTLSFTAVVSGDVVNEQIVTNTAYYTHAYGSGHASAAFTVLVLDRYTVFLPIIRR